MMAIFKNGQLDKTFLKKAHQMGIFQKFSFLNLVLKI